MHPRSPRVLSLAAGTVVAFAAGSLGTPGRASAVPTVYNLGLMPGGTYSTRGVVAGDGTTVTAFGDTTSFGPSQIRSFRWTVASGITHLLPLADARGGAISPDAFAISGGSGLAANGFHWTIPGGATMLNPLGGHTTCRSTGVSNAAAFICGSSVNGGSLVTAGRRAVRWTFAGVGTDLGVLSGWTGSNPGSQANGINGDGSVVVGYADWNTVAQTRRAFKWTAPAGPMVNLGINAGGTTSEALAVSADGSTVTGTADLPADPGQPRAFRHKVSTGLVNLGAITGDTYSWGQAVNANGNVVVGSSFQPFPVTFNRAFYWSTATGMVDLKAYAAANGANVTGWSFTDAWGVSADGRAVSGKGFFNGNERAFLITGLPCIPTVITVQPVPTAICATPIGVPTGGKGTVASFTFEAEAGEAVQTQWYVEVMSAIGPRMEYALSDLERFVDPASGLSFDAAGATAQTLTISNLRQGTFPAISVRLFGLVTNPCGPAIPTWMTTLTVNETCPGEPGIPCQPADIAADDGTPLLPAGGGHANGGVNEGDYNAFFQGFFDAAAYCDIANDDATARPPFGTDGINGGVNEGDYNCFFMRFFDGCP